MSERKIFRKIRPAAEVAAATMALAAVSIGIIVSRNHRELTHRSITLAGWLQKLADAEQRTYGIGEPRVWAAVHRIHHSIPDASLFPFYSIARAVKWMDENPGKTEGITIPDTFPHLDPYVDRFSREDVMTIGNQADDLIKRRLGKAYETPQGYTKKQLEQLFNPQDPQYTYPTKKHTGPYTQDDVARLLLTDPHSPPLYPAPNQTLGVLEHNVTLYHQPAEMFRVHPELKEADLQNKDGGNRKASRRDIAIGILIPSAGVFLRRHKFGLKDVAIALAVGTGIYGAKVGLVAAGGNFVNSYGHAGELTQKDIIKISLSPKYTPKLNEDGTVSTDLNEAGWLGRLISLATLDEVGGQEEHHRDPSKVAYTSKRDPWEAWVEAPFGEMLEKLAKSKYAPFITVGPGFNLQPGETRPDQPLPVMDIIHRRRAEQRARSLRR